MQGHPKTDLYIKEIDSGLKIREVAEKYGVTYHAVAKAIVKHSPEHMVKSRYTESSCVYPNLRKWLIENSVTRKEFLWLMGLSPSGSNQSRLGTYLRGEIFPGKKVIDKMLKATGMTYEELFWKGENNAAD